MIYYDSNDVSKGIYVNKTRESKEWDICCYWHVLKKWLKFQRNVWNECYDLEVTLSTTIVTFLF